MPIRRLFRYLDRFKPCGIEAPIPIRFIMFMAIQDVRYFGSVQYPGNSARNCKLFAIRSDGTCSGVIDTLNLYGIYNPHITPWDTLYKIDSVDYYTNLAPIINTTYSYEALLFVAGPTLPSNGAIIPGLSHTLTKKRNLSRR